MRPLQSSLACIIIGMLATPEDFEKNIRVIDPGYDNPKPTRAAPSRKPKTKKMGLSKRR